MPSASLFFAKRSLVSDESNWNARPPRPALWRVLLQLVQSRSTASALLEQGQSTVSASWRFHPEPVQDKREAAEPISTISPGGDESNSSPYAASLSLTERRLHEIWCRLLGRDDLAFEDDFFAAGGDSLSAVAMLAEADRRFGASASRQAACFFDKPTIPELARLIRSTRVPVPAEDIDRTRIDAYPVGSSGQPSPLFCIPANGDEGLYFRRLARHLAPVWPLTILRPREAKHTESPRMIEDAAAQIVQRMLAAQHTGTYRVAGYCFGGLIAYETARQLRRLGKTVEVVLIEVPAPGMPRPIRDWKLVLRRSLRELTALGTTMNPRRTIASAALLVRRMMWKGVVCARPFFERHWDAAPVRWVGRQARKGCPPFYLPRPIDSPVLHLISEVDGRMVRSAARFEWRRLALAGITERLVPLDHDTIFAESNLPILAAAIKRFFAASARAEEAQSLTRSVA